MTPQTQLTEKVNQARPRVVIVGAGFAGIQAAHTLRRVDVDITVIDRNNYHVFQPLLYQVATAGLSPADISAPIRHILRKQQNTTVLMDTVTGLDADRKLVFTNDREIPYDYLILATGATHSYFGHDEWREFAPGLKSIVDATGLRRKVLLAFESAEMEKDPERLEALLTFVLVGAGPTGVEMAGAIAELAHRALAKDFRHIDPRHARIILVEAAPRILSSFPESLTRKAHTALNHLGVEVRINAAVESIDAYGVVIAGKRIETQNVIWTAGVAASPAAKWLGVEADRSGRVKVEPDLSIPQHANIFVVGDTASVVQNGKPVPGVAPAAMQEGEYVARLITQEVKQGQKGERKPFHYINKGNLATVGRSFGLADLGFLRLSGFLGWLLWMAVHIFFLIGFRNRLLVMIQWAYAYITYQRGARLITQAPEPIPQRAEQRIPEAVKIS